MGQVRSYRRRTKSGRMVTVRAHTRRAPYRVGATKGNLKQGWQKRWRAQGISNAQIRRVKRSFRRTGMSPRTKRMIRRTYRRTGAFGR